MMKRMINKVGILLRSLFTEASFNYEYMQTWGFLFTLVPFLRKYKENQKFIEEFENRHKTFLNTHPFFATFITGAVIKEEENRLNKDKKEININKFKKVLSQSLAVSGDRFFWKYLKPICAVFGIIIIISNHFSPVSVLVGVLMFLLLFNLPALFFRISGMYLGYTLGRDLVRTTLIQKVEKLNYFLCIAGLFLIGFLVALEINLVYLEKIYALSVFLISFLVSFYLNLKKKFPSTAIYITMILSIGTYYLIKLIV